MPKDFSFARTFFHIVSLTAIPNSEIVSVMKIKPLQKKKKRWSPDEEFHKDTGRLAQLNKWSRNRKTHGFGG